MSTPHNIVMYLVMGTPGHFTFDNQMFMIFTIFDIEYVFDKHLKVIDTF